jgi:hypothetical protein
MTLTKRPFAVAAFCAVLLSCGSGALNARDADFAAQSVASAQSAKHQCINACRARYRDCRRLNQLPWSDCKGVYEDCTRYSCAGAGPG